MSDSDSDAQTSVKMPHADVSEGKAEKKPRKKMEVSERKRAASQANLAKAREARAKKKADKLAAENENQSILDELVAQQREKKKAAKEKLAEPTPVVFGEQRACTLPPEKPQNSARAVSKKHVPLSESEESEESEESVRGKLERG